MRKHIIVKHELSQLLYWNSALNQFVTDPEASTKYDTHEEPNNRIYNNPKIPVGGMYQVLEIIVK